MEVTLQDLKEFIEKNKGNEEVNNYIKGLNPITLDGVTNFVEKDDAGKKWLQSQSDLKVTKGIDTWKENNLQKLVDEAVKKQNPEETPEQKRLRELEGKVTETEKARLKSELKNQAITVATQKGLPLNIIDYFVGQDADSTNTNITALETVWGEAIENAVNDKLKGKGPGGGDNTNHDKDLGIGKLLAEQGNQQNNQSTNNPYFE